VGSAFYFAPSKSTAVEDYPFADSVGVDVPEKAVS
jgi:hypothetical protein